MDRPRISIIPYIAGREHTPVIECRTTKDQTMTVTAKETGRVALVLGATGGIGGHVARTLSDRGWTIRALSRRAEEASRQASGFQWIPGDALNRDDVEQAAEGVALIVHAVNPPGYKDWQTLVLPMLDNTIAAARASGARILLPGTIYNFGPDAFPLLSEDSPQNPVSRKGAIRVEMERRLQAASVDGIPVLIVRAGDFFGPGAGNNWFSQGVITPGSPITAVTRPQAAGTGHAWAYLPDVAETMVRLVELDDALPVFARYHMEGVWDADGGQMIRAIASVTGSSPKVKSFPWWVLRLAAPFKPLFREMMEMRYLWKEPLRLSNAKLVELLGEEPRTPLDEAVRATLLDLGCMPSRA
jgi:nucleoside-diphosphate-sugar epimerase